MKLPSHALLAAVAVGSAVLLAAPTAADAQGAAPAVAASRASGPHSAVTWNGWRGVHFCDTVSSAHRRLGGDLVRGSSDPGACGDILTTRTGVVDAKVGPHARRVSDISVSPSVAYPLGVRSSMSAGAIDKRLEAHGFTVRSHRVDATGGGDYVVETTSTGPHGHTLYFASDAKSGEVYRMGLALDRSVAHELLEINGC